MFGYWVGGVGGVGVACLYVVGVGGDGQDNTSTCRIISSHSNPATSTDYDDIPLLISAYRYGRQLLEHLYFDLVLVMCSPRTPAMDRHFMNSDLPTSLRLQPRHATFSL